MIAYVAYHATANRRAPDGSSQAAHWREKARRGDAHAAALLEGPRFPRSIGYLYTWFQDLSSTRTVGPFGLGAITFEQIDAWARLTDEHPQPHEISALRELDTAWRNAMSADDSTPAPTAAPDVPTVPARAWPTKRPTAEEAN